MLEILLVHFVLFDTVFVNSKQLSGFKFLDNNSTSPYTPENGQLYALMSNKTMKDVSICFKVNTYFQRYDSREYLFDISDESESIVVGVSVLDILDNPFFMLELNNQRRAKYETNADTTLLGKWVWYCFLVDLEDLDSSRMFMNGVELKHTPWGTKEINPPISIYKLRMGKYPIDGRPNLATFIDINAWDRALNEEEMKGLSDCKSNNSMGLEGNLINMKTQWIINSSLISGEAFDIDQTTCVAKNHNFDLFLPGQWNTYVGASESCHKITGSGMSLAFDDADKFKSLYKKANLLEGFVKECWIGARILTWLPFKSMKKTRDASKYLNTWTGSKPPGKLRTI